MAATLARTFHQVASKRCATLARVALVCVLFAGGAPPRAQEATPRFGAPELAALILDPDVAEISGIAGSRRADDLLWAINDGDNGSRLFALATDGRIRAAYTVRGVRNTDWEDLDAFVRDGVSYLLIADTGDNGGLRKESRLIVVREPDVTDRRYNGDLRPEWTIRFRWPDGPRDCEAVAVDVAQNEVLLFSKKRVPAQLFSVPLQRPARRDEIRVARQIAVTSNIPQPSARELAQDRNFGRFRGQLTAMDLSPDGRLLALLTYRDAYVFTRAPQESWRDALVRAPRALGLPPLPQGEAIAFDRQGRTIYATSERLPAPLLRVRVGR